MKRMELNGRRVLVTGASSGLGLEMARLLAREHKAHPILVARRKDKLAEIADELKGHGVEPAVVAADMTRHADVERTFAEATAGGPVHAVILNAGVTYFGRAVDQDHGSRDSLIATNVTAVVHLTQRFLPYLLERDEGGGVLLVSSMAGMQPMPWQAVYGATKAFLNSYGQALAEELRGHNLSVSVFCPGGIDTEMIAGSAMSKKYKKGHPMMMDPETCARIGLDSLVTRRRIAVPGALNALAALGAQYAPRSIVTRIVAREYGEVLPEPAKR